MPSTSLKPGPAAMFLLAASLFSVPVHAQFKCTQPDGKVSFQQSPCAADSSSKKLELREQAMPGAAAVPASSNWAAIATGRPAVGMTAKELEGAMGLPNVANLAQQGSDTADLFVYYRGNRTILVYVRNGLVTSIENRAGGEIGSNAEPRQCPTPYQMKNLEFEASKIANRGDSPAARALASARACR
jgi:hypothetical protein